MIDSRFETVFHNERELYSGLNIDDIGDLETLFMALFDRPLGVRWGQDPIDDLEGVEIIVPGPVYSTGMLHEFPFSIVSLVRDFVERVVDHVDGLDEEEAAEAAAMPDPDRLGALSDPELITLLKESLVKVRLYNLLYEDVDEDADED